MTANWNNTIHFDFKELTEFKERLKAIPYARLSDFLRKEATRLAGQAKQRATTETPVDTGTLRAAWRHLPARIVAQGVAESAVGNATEYAMYVEYGHRKRGNTGWVEGKRMLGKAEYELMYGGDSKLPMREQLKRNLDAFLTKELSK